MITSKIQVYFIFIVAIMFGVGFIALLLNGDFIWALKSLLLCIILLIIGIINKKKLNHD